MTGEWTGEKEGGVADERMMMMMTAMRLAALWSQRWLISSAAHSASCFKRQND